MKPESPDHRGYPAEFQKKLFAHVSLFDGVHVFTPHADVPDDSALRFVVLPPEQWFTKESPRQATDAVQDYLRAHGSQPRHRANRLMFVAADQAVLGRLRDAVRVALAWASIVEDVEKKRLTIDLAQLDQAKSESQAANAVLPRAARECFKWLLCPVQDDPKAERPTVETFAMNTTGDKAAVELERVCRENELIIENWSPIHLRTKLKELYWKDGRAAVGAMEFWEHSLRYLYLPRLRTREVLAAAIRIGAGSRDFFGTAYGQDNGKYDGFQFGEGNVSVNDTLLLIEPEEAQRYLIEQQKLNAARATEPGTTTDTAPSSAASRPGKEGSRPGKPGPAAPAAFKSFRGITDVPAATAKMKLVQIADEIIGLLASDPNASIRLTLDITAEFPTGVSEGIKRGVSENATSLGFKSKEWEKRSATIGATGAERTTLAILAYYLAIDP